MKSILIVAGEDLLTRFADIISKAGYRAITAHSAAETIELATSTLPDLILLVIAMPGFNGLQTAARLHSLLSPGHVPIILLGAVPPLGMKEEPLASYVDDYLRWDAPAEEIAACLRKHAGDPVTNEKITPLDH